MARRILPLVIISFFFLLAWQYQAVADWWFLRSYQPDEEIAALADDSYMSSHGRELFYLTDPEINDKEEFNERCPIIEESFVLGCYAKGRIHVLEVEREELDGIMEVTAAHEMLHKAYERLSESEREAVVADLEVVFAESDDELLHDLIARYEQRGGVSMRENELHSILPTQVVDLPQELETYYEQYFDDRQAVAQMYVDYEQVFLEINQRIDQLKDEVSGIRTQINALEQQINSQRDLIDELNRRLDQLEEEDDVEGYNELVPQQNRAVSEYNDLLEEYRIMISRHNQVVDEINQTVLYQADLVNSMDSTFQPL